MLVLFLSTHPPQLSSVPIPHLPTYRRIHAKDRILIMLPEHLESILALLKTLAIRGKPCYPKVGTYIWLAASSSSKVMGRALVAACLGPLSKTEWVAYRSHHMVTSERLYGNHTYAYKLEQVERLLCPIEIQRKRGSIDWQIGRWANC